MEFPLPQLVAAKPCGFLIQPKFRSDFTLRSFARNLDIKASLSQRHMGGASGMGEDSSGCWVFGLLVFGLLGFGLLYEHEECHHVQ